MFFRHSMCLVLVVAAAPVGIATAQNTSTDQKYVAPVMEFDKIIQKDGRQIAYFRLANPTDSVARYLGPAKSRPSLTLYTPHNLTRKHVNFIEYWSFCGNCTRIREFDLAAGETVECQVALPNQLAPFRLKTAFTESEFTPIIEPAP